MANSLVFMRAGHLVHSFDGALKFAAHCSADCEPEDATVNVQCLQLLENIFVSIFKNDLTFFVTFDEKEGHCIESPFYAAVSLLFSIILMSVVLHRTICGRRKAEEWNRSHRGRIRRLVFLMIPFCIIAAASIPQEFVSGTAQLVLKYLEAGLYVVFMVVYVHCLVLLPTMEARKVGLVRGSVTTWHEEPLHPADEQEHESELENLGSDHEGEESSKSPPEEVL